MIFPPTYSGLNVDGLYRVSGNLAVIQKLRFAVNHGMYSVCVYVVIVQVFCLSVHAFTCLSYLYSPKIMAMSSHVIDSQMPLLFVIFFYGH